MDAVIGITVIVLVCWGMLIAGCWLWWVHIGRTQGGTLTPTSWKAVMLMPVWTVRCQLDVKWRPRWAMRRRLKKLRAMEASAPPGVPQEIMQRLRGEIERLENELHRRRRR